MNEKRKKLTVKQEITQLEKQVAERLKVLTEIVNNAQKVLFTLGKEIFCRQGSANTHTKNEYVDGDFEIHGDFGQSMMGGNDLRIKYQKQPVFDASWQPFTFGKDGKIKLFEGGVWEEKLRHLSTRAKEKKEKEDALKTSKRAEEKRLTELRLQAEKLGLTSPT